MHGLPRQTAIEGDPQATSAAHLPEPLVWNCCEIAKNCHAIYGFHWKFKLLEQHAYYSWAMLGTSADLREGSSVCAQTNTKTPNYTMKSTEIKFYSL